MKRFLNLERSILGCLARKEFHLLIGRQNDLSVQSCKQMQGNRFELLWFFVTTFGRAFSDHVDAILWIKSHEHKSHEHKLGRG